MKEKLIALLENLKLKYSTKKSSEIIEILCEDLTIDELASLRDGENLFKKAINGQNNLFYDELAILFAEDLDHYTLIYFSFWEPLFEYLNPETKSYLFRSALTIPITSDATDYIKGFLALEDDDFDLALLYFRNIDYYVASYFVAYCFLYLDNFENSIKENEYFLKEFNHTITNISEENIDLREDPDFLIAKWNVYFDLGYAYNRISEPFTAKLYYEKSLEIFSLEDVFYVHGGANSESGEYEFVVFANNYINSLEKSNNIAKALEVVKFVIELHPRNVNQFKNLLLRLERKQKNHSLDSAVAQILRVKKPFGIVNFVDTRLVSKESLLEDLIVEQIKRGFKVFNKNLEVYEDDNIYGKQYPVRHCNGRLDLLLIDKDNDNLYVVELKRDGGGIEVVDQVEKYMEGIKLELNRAVKGIICMHQPNDALKDLVATKENIEIFVYEFQFRQV